MTSHLPEPKSLCWAWCQPDGSSLRPRDAAALPYNAAAHAQRLDQKLFGHKAFRLVPVIYVGTVAEKVLVRLEDSKIQLQIKPGLVLEWYEGLLILDALMRTSEQCQWLENLAERFQKERAHRTLSGTLYVTKKLLHSAVTGPQFVTREGAVFAHRRALRQDPPSSSKECLQAPGWYKVEKILDYMPPWDSFVHPKCGLYQEFYLILWAAPHVMESYAETPTGCDEQPHATWEPDECLPDHLDGERVQAKRRWIDAHRERENVAGAKEETKAPRVPRENPPKRFLGSGPLPPEKMAKVYHSDLGHSHIKHGLRDEFHTQLKDGEEHKIQQGWPKNFSDYPLDHAPAAPPGCCWDSCRCMEDWHLGDGTGWLEHEKNDKEYLRNHSVDNAMNNFKGQQNMLRLRGQVSKQWFYEPVAMPPSDQPFQSRRMALQVPEKVPEGSGRWEVANLVHKAMGAVVIPLPLDAISEEGGGDILRHLTILQDDEQLRASQDGGPFEPLAFEKIMGPDWLVVTASGHISANALTKPRLFKAETFALQVDFKAVDPSHRASLYLQIGPTKSALPESVSAWTGQIMDKVRCTSTVSFPLENFIKKVYDIEGRCLRKKVTLAVWLKTMKQVYTIARVAATSAAVRPGVS